MFHVHANYTMDILHTYKSLPPKMANDKLRGFIFNHKTSVLLTFWRFSIKCGRRRHSSIDIASQFNDFLSDIRFSFRVFCMHINMNDGKYFWQSVTSINIGMHTTLLQARTLRFTQQVCFTVLHIESRSLLLSIDTYISIYCEIYSEGFQPKFSELCNILYDSECLICIFFDIVGKKYALWYTKYLQDFTFQRANFAEFWGLKSICRFRIDLYINPIYI